MNWDGGGVGGASHDTDKSRRRSSAQQRSSLHRGSAGSITPALLNEGRQATSRRLQDDASAGGRRVRASRSHPRRGAPPRWPISRVAPQGARRARRGGGSCSTSCSRTCRSMPRSASSATRACPTSLSSFARSSRPTLDASSTSSTTGTSTATASSRHEFLRGLRLMGIKCRRKDANRCFDAWDRDRSGTLEVSDLQGMCRQSLSLPTKWRADPITLAELRPASAIPRAASRRRPSGGTSSQRCSRVHPRSCRHARWAACTRRPIGWRRGRRRGSRGRRRDFRDDIAALDEPNDEHNGLALGGAEDLQTSLSMKYGIGVKRWSSSGLALSDDSLRPPVEMPQIPPPIPCRRRPTTTSRAARRPRRGGEACPR